jgi:hypothetical protein
MNMRIVESVPGFSYHDRVFMVSGKGTRMDDTLWISHSPGSGLTQTVNDYKTALSDHPEFSIHTGSSHWVQEFKKWKSDRYNTPLKSKKIFGGTMEIYKIPVYPSVSANAAPGWGTGMAAYDIYNVNAHTNAGVHIPEKNIIKPIDYVYLVYSEQKNIFIHIMKTKNEAMSWFNSTTAVKESWIPTFESFLENLNN